MKEIMFEIACYCENCPISNKCIEKECVLFRIEEIILKEFDNKCN